ncbi:glycosyltransferase family 4 protein [Alteromonas flava]|uniref:glycosyltransferase family 4 protein n=1 Tax=Alteromonas flava TaxID=2048003 RepID=UPI000C283221|nr:glycosyltransferase family 4 protein [Alteromonas flava]
MRVVHIVSSLEVGGAERFVIDLATSQQELAGIEILSFGKPDEPLQTEACSAGLSVKCLSKQGVVEQILEIRRVVNNADLVHIHSSHALPRVLLAVCICKIRPRVIYTRHNEVVHTGLKWSFFYNLAYILKSKFVFVAENARQKFQFKYPKFKPLTYTILNGVNRIAKNDASRQGLHIGSVGRFVPLKSQEKLIEALSLLHSDAQSQITVHFYGTGPLMEEIVRLTKSKLPCSTVIFHGNEPDRDKIYNSFDALIVTSETEGLSLAILEAMSNKLPVIASNVGGNPELVRDNVNGFLYDYGDTQKLSELLLVLLKDTKLIKVLGNAGFQKYADQFSMDKCAKQYFDIYKDRNQ